MTKLNVEEIDKKYNVRHFIEAPKSKAAINPIQLDAIDFSLLKEGDEHKPARQKLANKLEDSLSKLGFVAITNHGIEHETYEHIISLAQSVCELPREVQKDYLAGAWKSDQENREKISTDKSGGERGTGFKPKGYWSMKNGVEDSIVHYNFNSIIQSDFLDTTKHKYPEIIEAHLKEIQDYFSQIHNNVLRRLTYLCDIILELPEGYLWENYFKPVDGDRQNSGGGVARFMRYTKMSTEDDEKVGKQWLRGHSDGGGITFITSQPILSLQIRDYYTGEWRYVGHIPNAFIVNVGDALEFITGGYFKSSIHRVVAPPEDQVNYTRLVLIYFADPKDNAELDPELLNSPKLKQLGYTKPEEWHKITFSQWGTDKDRLFGKKEVNQVAGDEPHLVLLHGRLHERWHQAEANFNLEQAKKKFKIIEL